MQKELIKSLVDAGFSESEAKEMLIEKAESGKKEEIEPKEDEWSEDEEKELEKSAKAANELLETYKSKRPSMKKDDISTEKSETESDLIKSIESEEVQSKINDIVKGQVSEIENSFAEKLSDIQKSIETISSFSEDIETLKEKIEGIGKQTPPQKSIFKAEDAILQKAQEGGIKDGDLTHLSAKAHKEQICTEISNLMGENKGTDLEKSLETDLMNYVAGSGILGDSAKMILRDKKNIIVA